MLKKTTFLILYAFLLTVTACSHYDDIMANGKESSYGGESHNSGQNCMRCHNESEYSEAVLEGGWWHVAGTVYGGKAKDVELWTGPNRTGEKVYSLQVDPIGNFFTAKIVNFKGGVYPVVVKKDGSVKAMSTAINTGACNSCHGVTTESIRVN